MPTPPAPATATQPTPPPATTAVEASSAISPATEKIIRTKHTYLTEDKEWDGEDIPEGWRSASRGPTHPAAPVPIAAESAPPTVPSPTMKPAPVSVPVEVSFPRPAAQKKRIRVKPNYLAEAKEWDGENVPEGWQNAPAPEASSVAPLLWNPQAASSLSFVFSPAFGALLHAKNAICLGRIKEARVNMIWFYICILYIALALISTLIENIPQSAYYVAAAVLLLSWYFHVAIKQEKFVKEVLHNEYRRRPWTAPLAVAASGWGLSVFALIVIFNATAIRQPDLQTRVRNDIQDALLKNPDMRGIQIRSFALVQENGNLYKGTLITATGIATETLNVDVTVQGNTFLWQIEAKPQPSLQPQRIAPQSSARIVFNQRPLHAPRPRIQDLIQPAQLHHLNPIATVFWIAVALGLLSYANTQKELAAFVGALLIIVATFFASSWIWASVWSVAVIVIVWLIPRENQ